VFARVTGPLVGGRIVRWCMPILPARGPSGCYSVAAGQLCFLLVPLRHLQKFLLCLDDLVSIVQRTSSIYAWRGRC